MTSGRMLQLSLLLGAAACTLYSSPPEDYVATPVGTSSSSGSPSSSSGSNIDASTSSSGGPDVQGTGYVALPVPTRVDWRSDVSEAPERCFTLPSVPPSATGVVLHVYLKKTVASASVINVLPKSKLSLRNKSTQLYMNVGEENTSNTVTVMFDGGEMCVSTQSPLNATFKGVVDVLGYYERGKGNLLTLTSPSRVVPPLSTANTLEVPVEDASATAVVLNITAPANTHTFPMYLQSYMCGSAPPGPDTPSVTDFPPMLSTSREVVVPAAGGRACLKLWSQGPTQANFPQLLVDRLGSFGAGGTLEFVPVEPSRLLDARRVPIAVTLVPTGITTTQPIPAGAQAIVGVASMFATSDGFLKIAAMGGFGESTSNLNFHPPDLAMVQFTSGLNGGLAVAGEHFNKTPFNTGLILDIMGYYRKVR
jgi:hypothetical protein